MAGKNVAQKLIEEHLQQGKMIPGEEISLQVDQTLCQDATGTMVMLELEAMQLKQVKTEISAQYVDHNIVQSDFKNPDDHLFLQTACARFGIWYSPPGNGVSHPVHMERFGKPGKFLLGSDSHTCAGGSLGMLSIGTGGMEVALAMAGLPFTMKMPKIMGVYLEGKLPDWVSAKDIILEMLRRHDVSGGVGKIIEYYGPGLDSLSAMDRHVIANMGAELGATTSVFPSDKITYAFLKSQKREKDFREILADSTADYEEKVEINLSKLEPLIACPSSPGNVVPVREVAKRKVFQAMVGSSANPGYRDFAIAALIVKGRKIHERISFDINPSSRQVLENLTREGLLLHLIQSGARIHQAGCNGCIGMGQAPATDKISLRTVPRNFPGRSGTKEDKVYLCSPETAVAAALTGEITDPRELDMEYPKAKEPEQLFLDQEMVYPPPKIKESIEIIKGPNIRSLPSFPSLKDSLEGPVLLKLGNNISTDEILPAGTKVLPFRSNIYEISKFTFGAVDETYYERAMKYQKTGSFIVGGANYGQGSSREHAAMAPRYLGVLGVIAKSYARIHRKNLINFGIIPFEFIREEDWKHIDLQEELKIEGIFEKIQKELPFTVKNLTKKQTFEVKCLLTENERKILLKGGLINYILEHHR